MEQATPTPAQEKTQLGFSYEYAVDIWDGTKWQPVRFISAVNPQVSAKEEDGATYDDAGADHPIRVGETVQLDFYIQQHRLESGAYLPEVELLLAATQPDALGTKSSVKVRYYDKPVGTQKANSNEAYELTATVTMQRANTANSGIGGWNITLKGQGSRHKVANPAISA